MDRQSKVEVVGAENGGGGSDYSEPFHVSYINAWHRCAREIQIHAIASLVQPEQVCLNVQGVMKSRTRGVD